MKKNTIVTTIIVAVIVGAVGFFAGMQFEKAQPRTSGQFAGQGQNGQARGQFGRRSGQGGAVMGEIISKDASSITVKLQDGSSKIIILSGTTAINKQATGAANDLKTGERVVVFGTPNADGSVTAQNIQLNPQFRGMRETTPSAQ